MKKTVLCKTTTITASIFFLIIAILSLYLLYKYHNDRFKFMVLYMLSLISMLAIVIEREILDFCKLGFSVGFFITQ